MREFDALRGYPEPKQPRSVGPNLRTIQNRIIAGYRGKEFYDGDRRNGYGGLKYDGRWLPIAQNMFKEYGLNEKSSVLQIGSDKGFLLHDFQQSYPNLNIRGIEVSDYAIETTMPKVKSNILKAPFTKLPFKDGEFDLVIAIGVVYSLGLSDAILALKEIERVGKGKSFITLGSYRNEEEFRLFRYWTLLGTTVLSEPDWIEVLKHTGYRGDYKFMNARTLNLVEEIN